MKANFLLFLLNLVIGIPFLTFNRIRINENEGLHKLLFLNGIWDVQTKQILINGEEIHEQGQAEISFILDSTYLKLEVELCRQESCRSYLQLISYDQESSTYTSRYFYNGTAITVLEKGYWDFPEHTLVLNGVNPWATERERGINIISNIQKKTENSWSLIVNELRNGVWDVGYTSIFSKIN